MPDGRRVVLRVRSILSTRTGKTLYIKADARVPYARLVEVIDAVQKSGVEGLTFLTAQQDAADHGKRLVPPKRPGTAGSLTHHGLVGVSSSPEGE